MNIYIIFSLLFVGANCIVEGVSDAITCAQVRCSKGHQCLEYDSGAFCHPIGKDCESIDCPEKTECGEFPLFGGFCTPKGRRSKRKWCKNNGKDGPICKSIRKKFCTDAQQKTCSEDEDCIRIKSGKIKLDHFECRPKTCGSPDACEPGYECVKADRYCFAPPCPQFHCVQCVACTKDIPRCEEGCENCETIFPKTCDKCPEAVCTDDCVVCPEVEPECKEGCGDCEIIPQTCDKCSEAVCKDCVVCPAVEPECKEGCKTCEKIPQTCDECPKAVCKDDEIEPKSCVFCPQAILECKEGCKKCEEIPQTCDKCSEAVCKDDEIEPKPCVFCPLAILECKEGCKKCEEIPQTCDKCSEAVCKDD